jgi:hypothetical protein
MNEPTTNATDDPSEARVVGSPTIEQFEFAFDAPFRPLAASVRGRACLA